MAEEDQRQLRYLGLDELVFDPENPRLPTHQQGATAEVALSWLLDRANLLDLMRSIAQSGYFAGEPILVVPEGDGKFKVVEGNRRFGACLLLSNPDQAPTKLRAVAQIAQEATYKPDRIPALVFDNELEVLDMLGYRHITGIQEWGPLAKAKYLRRLWDNLDDETTYYDGLKRIAASIGSRSDYVARLLTALALYDVIAEKEFFEVPELNEATISFSILVVAMNRPALADFIGLESGQDFELEGLNVEELHYLTRWFFEKLPNGSPLLLESRRMSDLVEVLDNEEATQALKSGQVTLQQALRIARTRDISIRAVLDEARPPVARAQQLSESASMTVAESDLQAALDLLTTVEKIVHTLRQRLR